ncbi:DNA-binding NtrC family response regulator [Plasticicumulans lactativorans]|uniref:DNA-binding NtrC family response regulator n=1 Tax=Plasticicumulans lactativorans TaxID=1133106 RepID=A0A4R2LBN6_9GAMM|nr:sigma-54 dependent transcriptional regulator [Plasticicumulans lactativorans]TCO83777.1 DNA-binding NtrC family response regulator [Plasticicumulans lactativorans]
MSANPLLPARHADARVLIIEDSPSMAELYRGYLRHERLRIQHVETGAAALQVLEAAPPHVVLLDLGLPDMNGMDILAHIVRLGLPTSVVIITANDSVAQAVAAMRAGAYDYLVKTQFDAERLRLTLRNAIERQHLNDLLDTLRDGSRERFCGFIGASLPMQAVYRIIESAAPSQATVFITGESGTGKELAADAIHRLSRRHAGPLIALNCAAIPHELMESEIFGHVKGAFTGALGERRGAAALADGGTLFLDEVCEMNPELQAKLLRFVQSGVFQPVGGSRQEKVDVRFVCATNRDPQREVESGRLREDLFYRLHVLPLHLPPLRERDTDVIAIARELLLRYAAEEGRRFRRFEREAEVLLLDYRWPGNVRELQNVVRQIVVLNDGDSVLPSMLPPALRLPRAPAGRPAAAAAASAPAAAPGPRRIRRLEDVERELIEEAIAACDGNVPRAAALLDISASTIYRKRQAWLDATAGH